MPKVHNNYNDTIQYTSYKNESELPRNIKIFIKELRRNLGDNLKLDDYVVSKSLLSPEHEDYDEEENNDDLDLEYNVDAESYARGKTIDSRNDIHRRFVHLADALGIENWSVFVKIINKKEFAEKFLKELKKYMKSTSVGKSIHSIRFDVKNTYDLELVFILKREFWRDYNKVREVAKEYLESLGYGKIQVHIP